MSLQFPIPRSLFDCQDKVFTVSLRSDQNHGSHLSLVKRLTPELSLKNQPNQNPRTSSSGTVLAPQTSAQLGHSPPHKPSPQNIIPSHQVLRSQERPTGLHASITSLTAPSSLVLATLVPRFQSPILHFKSFPNNSSSYLGSCRKGTLPRAPPLSALVLSGKTFRNIMERSFTNLKTHKPPSLIVNWEPLHFRLGRGFRGEGEKDSPLG